MNLNIQAKLLLLSLLTLLSTANCHAIALSDLKSYSYLNQPLDAEIELLGIDNFNVDELSVAVASAEDFAKMGINHEMSAGALEFQIMRNQKQAFIHVTSSKAITVPMTELLLDLTWQGGHLVRHYQLLLDPRPNGSTMPKRNRLLNVHQQANLRSSSKPILESLRALFEPENFNLSMASDKVINSFSDIGRPKAPKEELVSAALVKKKSEIPNEKQVIVELINKPFSVQIKLQTLLVFALISSVGIIALLIYKLKRKAKHNLIPHATELLAPALLNHPSPVDKSNYIIKAETIEEDSASLKLNIAKGYLNLDEVALAEELLYSILADSEAHLDIRSCAEDLLKSLELDSMDKLN